jgi:GNAT superfamily N-acetyltransferase
MSVTVLTLPDSVFVESVDAHALREDEAFWQLYEQAFPATEREPRDVIVATVEREAGFALRARTAGETIGMAFAHLLRDPPAIFLVYLAVDPNRRSRHLGTAILSAVDRFGTERLGAVGLESHGMVWEIDDPGSTTDPGELNIRVRRRAFFERAGGRPLDVPYVQPPVDGVTPVPMQLMYRPGEKSRVPDRAGAVALVRAIYFEKYGAMNGIPGPVLDRLLGSLR